MKFFISKVIDFFYLVKSFLGTLVFVLIAKLKRKIDINVSNRNPKMKLLLLHPGYSSARHIRNYEATIKLISNFFNVELFILKCNSLVTACGFISNVNTNLYEPLIKNKAKCLACQTRLKSDLSFKNVSWINLSSLINQKDIAFVEKQISSLTAITNPKDLLKLKYEGVLLGDRIWEAAQRFCLMGTPEKIEHIEKRTVIYEFIKTGYLYAIASNKLFNEMKFDLVLCNEMSYIEWGIPSRFAIKNKVPVMHQAHFYSGEKKLCLSLKTSSSELSNLPHLPSKDHFNNVFSDIKLSKKLIGNYKLSLDELSDYVKNLKYSSSSLDLSSDTRSAINTLENSKKPNILILVHLCWDSSLSFSEPVFETLEDWIISTFIAAKNLTSYNWIFKIHPAEIEENSVNKVFNSTHLINKLRAQHKPTNIFVINNPIDIKNTALLKKISSVISVTGTAAVEFPAMGIPCLLASRKGYSRYGFVTHSKSIEDYEFKLKTIRKSTLINNEKIKKARVLLGYLFDLNNYFIVDKINYTRFHKSSSIIIASKTRSNINYAKFIFNNSKQKFKNPPDFLKFIH